MSRPAVVVIGVGNPSRGDDALGPLLLDRIEAAGFGQVVIRRDFQLQLEHALDLCGADLVLFVDAMTGEGDDGVRFGEIGPKPNLGALSHALAPEVVLDVYQRIESRSPPPAFVLAMRGRSFELGDGLSELADSALGVGWQLCEELLRVPSLEDWREMTRRIGHAANRRGDYS